MNFIEEPEEPEVVFQTSKTQNTPTSYHVDERINDFLAYTSKTFVCLGRAKSDFLPVSLQTMLINLSGIDHLVRSTTTGVRLLIRTYAPYGLYTVKVKTAARAEEMVLLMVWLYCPLKFARELPRTFQIPEKNKRGPRLVFLHNGT